MKKTTGLLFALAMVLSLASCGGEASSTDFDASFFYGDSVAGDFCATEDTIYYVPGSPAPGNSNYIYYVDKATGVGGPLCGKAECTHTDSSCNAYVSGSLYGLSVYDGRLYLLSKSGLKVSICSVAMDGTDHRTEREFDEMESQLFPTSWSRRYALFHRGYAYFASVKCETIDGERVAHNYLCAFPLDPDEEAFVILDEYAMDAIYIDSFITVRPYGDSLYILTDRPSDSIEDYAGIDPKNVYDFKIRRWDTQTRELELLYQEDESPLYYTLSMYAADDGLLFCRAPSGTFANMGVYKYSFDGGEPEFLFSMGENVFGNVAVMDGIVAGCHRNDDGNWYVIIKDHEGNTLVEETYELDQYDWFYSHFVGADGTDAYFGWTNGAIVAVSLGDGTARFLRPAE